MVKVKEDLAGRKFGKWTVLYQVEDHVGPNGKHYDVWRCICDCPDKTIADVLGKNLKSGRSQSCGCRQRELAHQQGKNNKKYNEYDLNLTDNDGNMYGIGYCSNTGNKFYFDMEDYEKIKDYCWRENVFSSGYHALRSQDSDTKEDLLMHWLIVGKWYDHKDHNPLNNRKSNLRNATYRENAMNCSLRKNNTSGISGVYFNKNIDKWCARIRLGNGVRKTLGYFIEKDDAARARLYAEREYYGEFAPQQHLYSQYGIG